MKCYFCIGSVARTFNVTEKHTSNIDIPQTSKAADYIDSFSKKPNTKESLSNATKTSISDITCHKYQSYNRSNTEKMSPKKLKTEDVTLKNNPYGDIILWEKPGDNPQSILANSVNIAGGNIEWKYTQKKEYW